MSTRTIKSIDDFARHDMAIDVECPCGHTNTLNCWPVVSRFSRKGWCTSLLGSFGDSPYDHFYCTVCYQLGRGKVRPKWIGPAPR